MNSVQILGNLARDPVIRATKTGRAVASFTVAVNRNYTTPQGETKEITDWINVVAWGNLAENVGNNLRKGSRCFVEGRFTTRSYDTPDGQRRWVSEVTANFIAVPIVSKTNGAVTGSQASGYAGTTINSGGTQSQRGNFNQFGESYNEPQPMQQGTVFPEDGPSEEIPF